MREGRPGGQGLWSGGLGRTGDSLGVIRGVFLIGKVVVVVVGGMLMVGGRLVWRERVGRSGVILDVVV